MTDNLEQQQTIQVANPADGGVCYWLAKYYMFGAASLLALLVGAMPLSYLIVAATAPAPPDLKAYSEQAALETRILSSDGQVLTSLANQRRILVRVEDVPPLLIKAFLAAEDRAFFEHGGVDFRGILRAFLANFRAGEVRQGGSTITQQVAKSYLSPERTIQRKMKEIVLSRRIEARFSKKEILYLYLNHIFFGANAYGVGAAARTYFGKTPAKLTLGEMALLAGLVRAPSRFSPLNNLELATKRRNQVLAAMKDAGYISQSKLQTGIKEPLLLARAKESSDNLPWISPHFTEHIRRTLLDKYGRDKIYNGGLEIDTTVDLNLQTLAHNQTHQSVNALDKRQGWRGPFYRVRSAAQKMEILTRIDHLYDLKQLRTDRPYPAIIEKVASTSVAAKIGQRHITIPLELMNWAAPYSRTDAENDRTIEDITGVLNPGDMVWVTSPPKWLRRKSWGSLAEKNTTMALHQIPRVEGAIYTYDHQSGYVLAMVGGLDHDRSTFNRTVQACRQPGSTYKAIYYSLALDRDDFSMGMILHDKPYEPAPGEEWNPQNIHGTLDGNVTMHMALVKSLNLPSIELLDKVGAEDAAKWARRLGFTTPIHADKALALGASCVRVDELTRAFATFARGGSQMDPVYIRQIRDRHKQVIEDHSIAEDPLLSEDDRLDRIWAKSTTRPNQVIDSRTAFLITKLLRDCVLYGIAARCQIVPAPTAGKGGTSSDTMDVWFVGFTSQWATTVWMGDDKYQRPLGAKEASYTSAIPMWANYMKDAVGKRPDVELPYTSHEGLESTTIDFQTGGPPTADGKTVKIYFRPGSFELPANNQETQDQH